jgi:flagellar motor protein MotB
VRKRSGTLPSASRAGDYWPAITVLLAGLLAVFVFAAGIPPDPIEPPPPSHDAEVHTLVVDQTIALQQWQTILAQLCRNPEILALKLQPDCRSGTIALPSRDYFQERSNELTDEGKRRLRRLVPALLSVLRRNENVWQELSAIEIRGHADPQAIRDRYATNLITSQERALAMLLFLSSDEEVPEHDRADLQRLAVASGASDSRPPRDCRQQTRQCYERARRVEIRLNADDLALRARLGSFYNQVSRLVGDAP